ncbi:MAG TPA: hypothetical protein VF288_07370 [Mycobacteriales bacterium]
MELTSVCSLRRVAAAAALAIAAVVAAGCGSNHDAASNPSSSAPAAHPTSTLDVQALDYSYRISGSPHAGLISMTFSNHGKYAHEMGVSKLKPGATLAQVTAALAAPDGEEAATKLIDDPDAEYPVPSIVGPGLSVTVVSHLDAGHYVVVCFLPGPDGMPHVAMGMIGEFTVDPAPSTLQPPHADGTVVLTDAGITLPAGFASGGTFAVRNTGTSEHDFSVARLKTAGTLEQYFGCVSGSFEKSTPVDSCPGTLAGGVEGLDPGATAYVTMHLASGQYGYVSTAGDGKDFAAGLHGEFAVA